jgi:hypothetical protein
MFISNENFNAITVIFVYDTERTLVFITIIISQQFHKN